MSLKPTRYWRQKTPRPGSPKQVMAWKENYQLFQLKGMLGHLEYLVYVDHRNAARYKALAGEINSLISIIKQRQSCRVNPNQSKCADIEAPNEII